MKIEPNFDQAEGIGPLFPDILVSSEAGPSVDEERLRVEVVAAALQLIAIGGRRKHEDPVDVAKGDEPFTPVANAMKVLQTCIYKLVKKVL